MANAAFDLDDTLKRLAPGMARAVTREELFKAQLDMLATLDAQARLIVAVRDRNPEAIAQAADAHADAMQAMFAGVKAMWNRWEADHG